MDHPAALADLPTGLAVQDRESTPRQRPRLAIALCLAAGAAAALAPPPFGFLPGLLGYAAILALLERSAARAPLRSAFWRGWLAGVGYFLVSLYWLIEPFQVDAKDQGWMAPIALAAMVGGMSLYWGLAGFAYRLAAGRSVLRVLWFAAVLAGCEWLRGRLFTGFPWDLPGESWRAGSAPSQGAALIGAYGLTWFTLAASAAPVLFFEKGRRALAGLAGPAAIAALWAFGAVRLAHPPPARPDAPLVRIVQADVPQAEKYDEADFADIVERYVVLTARPANPPAQVVVWSEGAIPDALGEYLASGTWTEEMIAGALAPNQTLLTGGYRFAQDAKGKSIAFNSLAAVRVRNGRAAIVAVYDKHRLVPFGEYIPFDALAARIGFKQLVHVGQGFTPGPPSRPMRLSGLPPFQPLICYEALFPGFIRSGARAVGFRPSWIVNVSNDAWFGSGSGPIQHLNLASYRAIESGLPMVRATPTGYSAMIDAFGRVIPGERLGHGAFGDIDAALPPALAPTPYFRFGEAPFAILLLVSLLGTLPLRTSFARRGR